MNSTSGITVRTWRSSLSAGFAAVAVGGIGVILLTGPAAPSVSAAPDPCAASQVARTVGTVAINTGTYLDAHPATNQALTTISQQQGGPQSIAALKAYFDANPTAAADLQRLQQPLASLSGRCKLPVTIPQLLGVMQAVQQQSPAQPGGVPAAQAVGTELPASASTPVQRPVSPVTGPFPGPGTTPSR